MGRRQAQTYLIAAAAVGLGCILVCADCLTVQVSIRSAPLGIPKSQDMGSQLAGLLGYAV